MLRGRRSSVALLSSLVVALSLVPGVALSGPARPLEPFVPGSGISLPDESVWRLRLDFDVNF